MLLKIIQTLKQSLNVLELFISMYNYNIQQVHISDIIVGDTILHTDGKLTTVCKNNIKRGGFLGTTLFGDSYKSGRIMVKKIIFIKAT